MKHSEIFYNDIYSLINNLLINNKNYTNGYYSALYDYNSRTQPFNKLLEDTKERAKYILDRMESEKHLIDEEKEKYD